MDLHPEGPVADDTLLLALYRDVLDRRLLPILNVLEDSLLAVTPHSKLLTIVHHGLALQAEPVALWLILPMTPVAILVSGLEGSPPPLCPPLPCRPPLAARPSRLC